MAVATWSNGRWNIDVTVTVPITPPSQYQSVPMMTAWVRRLPTCGLWRHIFWKLVTRIRDFYPKKVENFMIYIHLVISIIQFKISLQRSEYKWHEICTGFLWKWPSSSWTNSPTRVNPDKKSWSFRLGVRRRVKNPSPSNTIVYNPPVRGRHVHKIGLKIYEKKLLQRNFEEKIRETNIKMCLAAFVF